MMQRYTELPQSLSMLGVSITPFDSYNHVVECILSRINIRKKTFCFAINPEKVYRAVCDSNFCAIFNKADIQICDGIGIVYATRLLLGKKIKRCTGIQLFFDLIHMAVEQKLKVFLLGASDKSNKLACSDLLKMYPNLKIVGCKDGYFKDSNTIIRDINKSKADMLFVAMGSPKQELWITEHRETINVPFCMGVGGTLDVISGCIKWAPKIFRKTGTEFLYRLITNPKKWRRQLVLPKFVLMVLKEKFFHTNCRHCR